MANNSKLFIGFSGGFLGSNGVGKTTAANYLVKKYKFHLCNLLHPVEESAKKLCKWNGAKDKNGLSILNQTCISGRKINENYWLNISLASMPTGANRVVFDNVFFENEAKFIRELNKGILIHIEREGFMSNFIDIIYDHNITNRGSINDFEKKIDDLINKLYNTNNVKK